MRNVTYINAGAGSGKTYTLTELLADVLAEGKATPEQVILTTFTVKAANDFKEKSKAKLFQKGLFDEANMLDGALIGTIHSVAYSIISAFWYYLGLPPKPEIMTEEDGDIYRAQSLGALPEKEELRLLRDFAEKFEIRDSRGMFVNYDFWQEHLSAIIGFTTNYEIEDYDRSRNMSKAQFMEFLDPYAPSLPDSQEIIKALGILADIFAAQKKSDTNEKRRKTVVELSRRAHRPSFPLYKELLRLGTSIRAAREHPFISSINDRVARMWQTQEVYDSLAGYIDLIFDLAERWRNRYERFKEERNILDFNDLEKYLLRLLRDPVAAAQIGEKYRYLFVDEFQDCSPIQIKIFREFSRLARHSYWVGDMKQSIFGFRGSDTKLTDAVIGRIEAPDNNGCDIRTLPNSWRSVPGIVDFCNDMFVRAFSREIPEQRVRLHPVKNVDPQLPPLIIWNVEDKDTLPDFIARLIKEGASPGEIAVLNRKSDPLNELGAQLAGRNIPVNLSTEPIMNSRVALLAKAILSVADNDADSLSKGEVAFLLDSRFNTDKLISETLAHINPQTGRPEHYFLDDIPVLRRLSGIRDRLKQQSVAEFVESVILELNIYEEAMKCAPVKECVNVLDTIISAARDYEELSLRMDVTPTVRGYIDYLESDGVTLPGDPDGVVLLTMHKSKGLEWKYVIITSLSSNPANEKSVMKREFFGVHFRRDEDPSGENLFPEVYVSLMPFIYGHGNTSVPPAIEGIISAKPQFTKLCNDKIAEETRLLYVAMTRPSHQLILSINGRNPLRWFTDMGLDDIADISFLKEKYGFVSASWEGEACLDVISRPKKTYLIGQEMVFERRDCSPSLLSGKANVAFSADFGRRIPLGKFPKEVDMDAVGNCIHHIFSLCGERYPADDRVRELIASYGLETVLCVRPEIEHAWNRLVSFIEDRHGAIFECGYERPFIYNKEGKTYTGSIDFTAETPDGIILVDYKTCPLGNDRILNEEDSHFAGLYGGQIGCYREALFSAGLKVKASYVYYPVSGLIVELAP